ncbi:hypothetical protein Q7O_000272 [Pectobacterium carotovorum subsp. carotovorum PCCS1]|nr:hypothetical protein [Pectobacterium carotovorum subsp. carotovorum PCCS1]
MKIREERENARFIRWFYRHLMQKPHLFFSSLLGGGCAIPH